MSLTQDSDIHRILEQTKTIAVVGYSDKPDRPSHQVANTLMAAGYEVYLVNPLLQSTVDQKIYASLSDIPVPIDVVDIFRRADDVPHVVEEAIAIHAKVVWMQLGIINEQAAVQAEQAGLQVVMDRCMKIEYEKLMSEKTTLR